MARLLLENDADLHSGNECALRDACFNGNLEVVEFLVDNGADIHACDDYAFIWACYRGNLEIVKYLVSKGADIHAEGDAAFTWAEQYGHTEVLAYLKSLVPTEPKPKSRFPKKPIHITFRDNDRCPITHDPFTADTPTIGCSKCRNKFIKEADVLREMDIPQYIADLNKPRVTFVRFPCCSRPEVLCLMQLLPRIQPIGIVTSCA